jgi:hypothetical protein
MKHSGHTENSGKTDMRDFIELLEFHLLDLLVDGPSSFAALYGGLIRNWDYPSNLKVTDAMYALEQMKKQEWVKECQMTEDGSFHQVTEPERTSLSLAYQAWLSSVQYQDLSVDEIGLWYEITIKGRAEWNKWVENQKDKESHKWMLDDMVGEHRIVIHAESNKTAETVLRWWSNSHPEIELLDNSKQVEKVSSFKLRDDSVITNGIRLICHYHLIPSPNDTKS